MDRGRVGIGASYASYLSFVAESLGEPTGDIPVANGGGEGGRGDATREEAGEIAMDEGMVFLVLDSSAARKSGS